MTTRITRKTLENKLERVNMYLEEHGKPRLQLDVNHIYGGYQLDYEGGNNHVSTRMPGKEMFAYLDGMETALWMVK